MKLTDCKVEKLLPLFMRAEKDDLAIARQLDPVIRMIGEKIVTCSDWGYIDVMPEEFVDALAWELDVDWYNPKADRSLAVKRELVKNADEVHRHLGTRAAVESVAKDIFGDGHVEEWFDYSGTPGTFKVWISTQLTSDTVARFMKTIGQVKNTRSHLIAVTCRIIADMDGPDIEYEDIPESYGETEIYNDFRFYTNIDETFDTVALALSIGMAIEEQESILTAAEIGFTAENSETADAKIVKQSDPLYRYNGVHIYNGAINYDSYNEEEDL